MSVSSQPKNKSTVIAENAAFSSNWGDGDGVQKRNTAPAENSHTRRRIRVKKVLTVRQQLAEGRYNLDKRINAVLDRILETLIA
jgi:anti-sigma28 factor (negative regulator of flagellin synthesis)